MYHFKKKNMKDKKYKIVIFTDLKESLESSLKSTLSLIKIFNSEISIFHVKKALDVVKIESQLSAMRSLNGEYIDMEKQIKSIVETYSKKYDVPLSYSCAIGNVKNEIGKYIASEKPDILVLGKRKSKVLNVFGDRLTKFILKKHKGPVMFTDSTNVLELNSNLSLGIINDSEESSITDFAASLATHSQKPIKSFKIASDKKPSLNSKEKVGIKEIEFVFDQNDHTLKTISNYISISKVNLLCINRDDIYSNSKNKSLSLITSVTDIINNLNVPLILTAQHTLKGNS